MGSIIPILAALFGALAAGGFKTIVDMIERSRTKEATLTAIATEVATLCTMIRAHQYLESALSLLGEMETEEWQREPSVLIIDIRENYFTAYQALISSIGLLEPHQAQAIVEFYSLCRNAIDAHRPDGLIPREGNKEERSAHVRAGVVLFTRILKLGDDISQFPKHGIPATHLRLVPKAPLSTAKKLPAPEARV